MIHNEASDVYDSVPYKSTQKEKKKKQASGLLTPKVDPMTKLSFDGALSAQHYYLFGPYSNHVPR
jgi:hypothetical protein